MTTERGRTVSDKSVARDSKWLRAKDGNEYERIARRYTPSNVKRVGFRRSLTGRAWLSRDIMEAPKPTTPEALYMYLHECGHMTLHTRDAGGYSKPLYVKEYEAETWAHAKMAEAGIPVPEAMTERAKRYVRGKVSAAIKRGGKIPEHIKAWCGWTDEDTRNTLPQTGYHTTGAAWPAEHRGVEIAIGSYQCNEDGARRYKISAREDGHYPWQWGSAWVWPHTDGYRVKIRVADGPTVAEGVYATLDDAVAAFAAGDHFRDPEVVPEQTIAVTPTPAPKAVVPAYVLTSADYAASLIIAAL